MQMACTLRNLTSGFYYTALDDNTICDQTTGEDRKVVGIAHFITVSTTAWHDWGKPQNPVMITGLQEKGLGHSKYNGNCPKYNTYIWEEN